MTEPAAQTEEPTPSVEDQAAAAAAAEAAAAAKAARVADKLNHQVGLQPEMPSGCCEALARAGASGQLIASRVERGRG